MALLNAKILETERNAVYVKSVPGERLTGNVQQNKDVFDKFPQLIMGKYNDLVDLLISLNLDNITTDLSDRYTKTEADAKITEETNSLVANVTINTDTGVITITKKDGTAQSVDTALEKVPATFEFVEDIENDKYYLKITNVDGTTSQTEVTNLMNQFTFTSGDIVTFSQNTNGTTTTITASIKAGSIGFNELKSEVKAYIDTKAADISADKEIVLAAKTEVLNASQSVTANTTIVLNAKDDATAQANKAKSYAVGNTGTREGEDTDNAQYYSNQANLRANDAYGYMVEAKNAAATATGFDYKGEWDPNTTYTQGQIASYNSTLWTAKTNNLNSIPYDGSADWSVFVGIPSVLDLGGFTDTLAEHVMNPNAHAAAVFDANNSEPTTQATLEEHEISETAHGNLNIDGGGQ